MSDDSPPVANPAGRSWRQIRQAVDDRALSHQGRSRRRGEWLQFGLVTGLLAGLGWGGLTLAESWTHDRAALATAVRSEPVREVVLLTDGVLTRPWVQQVLALPPGAPLLALDLPALRSRLTAHGQVRVAVLTRSFPDTLVVTLQERTPVVRLQVQEGGPRLRQLLVARDGVAYEGHNYPAALVASLPWLDGVRLTRTRTGYRPVPGLDAVADLLTTAQLQAPQLYRNWLIVSLARHAAQGEILVRSAEIPEIIFTVREDFFKQLAQLDYIADTTARLPDAELQSVNLTLGGQVPVRLNRGPADLARQAPAGVPIPNFSLTPPPLPKGKRDL